jgi:hypothetical protein
VSISGEVNDDGNNPSSERSTHEKRAGRIGRIECLFRNRISIMRICHNYIHGSHKY